MQATDGNLYGTAYAGGSNKCDGGCGTFFKITPAGKLTTLHSFNGTDGANPFGEFVQAIDGNFYGTTYSGGPSNSCPGGCGTVFEITKGTLTTLGSFDNIDGAYPSGLVQATDGNFYGTTVAGNPNGYGTIFRVTPGATLTTLHSFDGIHGIDPLAGLVQASDGNFYGATNNGGAVQCGNPNGNGCGTVFRLSVGLVPFVETRPTSGKMGDDVEILGNNLTGATSVTFDGVPAEFKVVSSSEITSIVPCGARTGEVEVKTPSRTLSSNVPFRITP